MCSGLQGSEVIRNYHLVPGLTEHLAGNSSGHHMNSKKGFSV